MDKGEIRAAAAQERRRIADLIEQLDEPQLATPSLCDGWDVKTVAAHLVSILREGTLRVTLRGLYRGGSDRAFDELARRDARLPAAEIASRLRELADHHYWRPPTQEPGLLAEVQAHGGDIRIPLGLPFEPDATLVTATLDYLTGPLAIGLVPLRRLRGIKFQATDIGRAWGDGAEIRGRGADLLMAAIGRTAVLGALDGPGIPLLRERFR